MYGRLLSNGSTAAALVTLLFVAGSDVAEAARCRLGEIYRPSRGICVTKERAVQAGIYHGVGRSHVRLSRVAASTSAKSDAEADAALTPAPKPRPQALVAIEREAPTPRRKAQEALAFMHERQPESVSAKTPIEPKSVQVLPVAYQRPQASPFGSLVALEPLP